MYQAPFRLIDACRVLKFHCGNPVAPTRAEKRSLARNDVAWCSFVSLLKPFSTATKSQCKIISHSWLDIGWVICWALSCTRYKRQNKQWWIRQGRFGYTVWVQKRTDQSGNSTTWHKPVPINPPVPPLPHPFRQCAYLSKTQLQLTSTIVLISADHTLSVSLSPPKSPS